MTVKQNELMACTGWLLMIAVWGDKFQLNEAELQPPGPHGFNVIAISAARISNYSGCSLVSEETPCA